MSTKIDKDFSIAVHELAKAKGWWPETQDKLPSVTRALLMIHAEVSETVECFRELDPQMSEKTPEFLQYEEELADVIIRVLDLGEYLECDLLGAVKAKHEYNKSRGYRHGNKQL